MERSMAGDDEEPSRSKDIQSLVVSSFTTNNKLRKTETPSSSSSSSSSSSKQSSLSLNGLHVYLIEEILQRLPTAKSASLCKCVCKNWYSLISSPYFVRRFITHHLNHHYEQNPSALIINCWGDPNGDGLFIISDEPNFKSRGFELNYLPVKNRSFEVVAIFNDLLLCQSYMSGGLHCYICNPFTMQWIALPLLESDEVVGGNQIGFICETNHFEDNQGENAINGSYRFRVVYFKETVSHKIIWTYCSETQKWYRSVLEGLEFRWPTGVVAYNGKLLWYNGKRMFVYDPFNPEVYTFLDCPYIQSTKLASGGRYCLGMCRGSLRLMQFACRPFRRIKGLTIWELEDYSTWEWSLKARFHVDAMRPESYFVLKMLDDQNIQPLGFHPSDGDIVYLQVKAFVISFNTQTRKLIMVRKLPGESDCHRHHHVFHIELPLWPTPLPKSIENLACG